MTTGRSIDWSTAANVLMGTGVMILALHRPDWTFDPLRMVLFLSLFGCGLAIDLVGAGAVPRVNRAFGVGSHHPHVGVLRLEVIADARYGAARAHAAHQHVYLALELPPDFGAGGLEVGARVHGVEVLVGLEGPRDVAGQAVGHVVVALLALAGHGGGGRDHLGSVGFEERNLLLRDFVGHDEHALVAHDGRRNRQPGARVAGRRLDEGAPLLEQALLLGVLDHGDAYAVLHRVAGVEHLQLGEQGGLEAPVQPGQAHYGRVAYRIEYAIVDFHVPSFHRSGTRRAPTGAAAGSAARPQS